MDAATTTSTTSSTGRRRQLAGALFVALVVLASTFFAGASASGAAPSDGPAAVDGRSAAVTARDSTRAKTFWTRERMLAAKPLDVGLKAGSDATARGRTPGRGKPFQAAPTLGAVEADVAASAVTPRAGTTEGFWNGSNLAAPARQVGRLFFQSYSPQAGSWYQSSCSATVVSAENRSVVWTAGHCVFQTYSNLWNRNYVFCPGYRNGSCPLGQWTPYRQGTTAQWQNSVCSISLRCSPREFNYDFGVLKMNPLGGYRIQQWVGSHGVAFNGAAVQNRHLFGYPLNKGNGQYLYACIGQNGTYEGNLWLTCTAGGGASGGPWLSGFNSQSIGWVHSVNSHGGEGYLGAPYQGAVAKQLYDANRY